MPWPHEPEVWRDLKNVERLVQMFNAGASQSEMARQFDCSRTAVHSKLDRLGLIPEARFEPLPPPQQPKPQPLPPGAVTLPPLPSLLMPFPKIGAS